MIRYLAPFALLIAGPAAAQTQAQMNHDTATDYARADAAMNAQWKRTFAALKARDAAGPPSGHAGVLLATQRAWLRLRDDHCRLLGSQYAGGSIQPMAIAQCRAELTRQRTAQLKNLVPQR